jgi:hypothetical protein
MGVGVQLHSLLLFTLPIVFVIWGVYLLWRKSPAWKFAPLIILVAFVFNIPQINYELQTGGKNTQAFWKGLDNKSSREGSLPYKFALNTVCHIQANSFMILPIGSTGSCDFMDAGKKMKKGGVTENWMFFGSIFFALFFSVGGYFLLIRGWWREKDEARKNMLSLILLYSGVMFVILIPLAAEISLRFFLVLQFMPFLLLAFWLKFLGEKFPKIEASIVVTMVTSIVAVNVFVVTQNFSYLEGNRKEGESGFEEITLGEVQFLANFISEKSPDTKNVYLRGKAGELFKIVKPIRYFTDEKKLNIKELKKNDMPGAQDKIFLIDIIKDPKKTEDNSKLEGNYEIMSSEKWRRVKIYELRQKE